MLTDKAMKAEELRIGNYVLYNYKNNSPAIVNELMVGAYRLTLVDAKEDMHKGFLTPTIYVKPIPLSEEWLTKFGFAFYEPLNHYRIVIDDVWYYVNKDFYFSFCNLKADESQHMPYKKLNYVHQLQNLYFALTGEELTLKP